MYAMVSAPIKVWRYFNSFSFWGGKVTRWTAFSKQFVVRSTTVGTTKRFLFNQAFFFDLQVVFLFLRYFGRRVSSIRFFFIGSRTAPRPFNRTLFDYKFVFVSPKIGFVRFQGMTIFDWRPGLLRNPTFARLNTPVKKRATFFLSFRKWIRQELERLQRPYTLLTPAHRKRFDVYQKANLGLVFKLTHVNQLRELMFLNIPLIGFADVDYPGELLSYRINFGIGQEESAHFFFQLIWEQLRIGQLAKRNNEISLFDMYALPELKISVGFVVKRALFNRGERFKTQLYTKLWQFYRYHQLTYDFNFMEAYHLSPLKVLWYHHHSEAWRYEKRFELIYNYLDRCAGIPVDFNTSGNCRVPSDLVRPVYQLPVLTDFSTKVNVRVELTTLISLFHLSKVCAAHFFPYLWGRPHQRKQFVLKQLLQGFGTTSLSRHFKMFWQYWISAKKRLFDVLNRQVGFAYVWFKWLSKLLPARTTFLTTCASLNFFRRVTRLKLFFAGHRLPHAHLRAQVRTYMLLCLKPWRDYLKRALRVRTRLVHLFDFSSAVPRVKVRLNDSDSFFSWGFALFFLRERQIPMHAMREIVFPLFYKRGQVLSSQVVWPTPIKALRKQADYFRVVTSFLDRNRAMLWKWVKIHETRIGRRRKHFSQPMDTFLRTQLLFAWFTNYLLRTKIEPFFLRRYLVRLRHVLLTTYVPRSKLYYMRKKLLFVNRQWRFYRRRGFLETTTFHPLLKTHAGRKRFNELKRQYRIRRAQPWVPFHKFRPKVKPISIDPTLPRSTYLSGVISKFKKFRHVLISQ